MNLQYKAIDEENWEDVYNLEVNEEQKEFVAPNGYSIIEAFYDEEHTPLALYDGEELIGFAMYDMCIEEDRLTIVRFMIHKDFQGKGYGKAGMVLMCELLKEKFGSRPCYLSFEPENTVADKLYASIGFEKTGELVYDEIEAVKSL